MAPYKCLTLSAGLEEPITMFSRLQLDEMDKKKTGRLSYRTVSWEFSQLTKMKTGNFIIKKAGK